MRNFLIILIFILTASQSVSESISSDALVSRENITYQKFSIEPYSGKVVDFYKNGQLQKIGQYTNGKKQGIWESYTERGDLKSRGEYRANEREGKWRMITGGDSIFTEISIFTYKGGKKEGPVSVYEFGKFEDSCATGKGTYVNDQLEGEWLGFDLYKVNNKCVIREKGFYDRGKKVGKWLTFHTSRKLCYKQKTCERIKSIIHYKNNKKDGETKVYFADGTIDEEGAFKDDRKNGTWILYPIKHVNGYYVRDKIIEQYSLGDLHGKWEAYFPEGMPAAIGNYYYGTKDGLFENYFDDGTLRSKRYFIKNIPNGLHEYYFPSGEIWKKENFKRGTKHGIFVEFMVDGSLKYQISYKNGEEHGFYKQGLSEGTFMFGNRAGPWQEECYSCPNDAKITRGNYKDGKRQGEWHYYKINEEKVMTITYLDDNKTDCRWYGEQMDNECINILSSKRKKY